MFTFILYINKGQKKLNNLFIVPQTAHFFIYKDGNETYLFFYQSHFCYLPTQTYFSAAFNLIVLS